MDFSTTTKGTTFMACVHTVLLHSANTTVSPFGTFLLLRNLRALSLHIRERIRGAGGILSCLSGGPLIGGVGRPSLSPGCGSLCSGCFPGNTNSVFAFSVSNNRTRTGGFVSGLRVFSLLTGITSIGSLIVRPGAAARSRLSRRRFGGRRVGSSAVELSVNARRVSSVVTSLRGNFGTVDGWTQLGGGKTGGRNYVWWYGQTRQGGASSWVGRFHGNEKHKHGCFYGT